MEFGFSMNAFRQQELTDGVCSLAEIGYDGVEILLDEPHLFPGEADDEDVERVRALLADNDIAVSNCNAFMLSGIDLSEEIRASEYVRDTEDFHHPSFVEYSEPDRRARIEHTKNALRTAAALDADHISIPPGGPIPERVSETEAMEAFVDGVRAVTETAEEVGVDVLVEPEPDLLIETSDDFLAFIDRIDSPRVGCNFDAGHFYSVGEDPAELVDKLAEYTPHYHIEDIPADRTHVHTQLGEGSMDINGFLETVADSDYDGFVTVELYTYGENPTETARTAMQYLEENGWT